MIDGHSNTLFFSIEVISILFVVISSGMFFVFLRKKKIFQQRIEDQKIEIEHQKQMLKTAFESQENERKYLAKELHDDIGMMLMTLRINLNDQKEDPAHELRLLVDKTHESIRRLSWDLMPTTMDNFGLFQATHEMCERLSSIHTASIRFHEEGVRMSLDKDQELLLYRIAQEAITNAIKHSNASKINVLFSWTRESLTLSITDDGLGFDFPTTKNKISGRHGLGLFNMENRVALLGGELTFEKNQPSGTVVAVELSLPS